MAWKISDFMESVLRDIVCFIYMEIKSQFLEVRSCSTSYMNWDISQIHLAENRRKQTNGIRGYGKTFSTFISILKSYLMY